MGIGAYLDKVLARRGTSEAQQTLPTGATFGSAATRLLAKRKREDKLTHAGMAATKKDWTGHGKFRSTQPVSYHANLPTQPGFLQSIEMLAATSQIMPAVSV
jgi:hypothetical protein